MWEHGFESRWGHHSDLVKVLRERFPSRVGRDGNPLGRCTSVFLIEQVHDLLQILRREPRVDRRRLDVGVTEMLLHRAEVTAGALE